MNIKERVQRKTNKKIMLVEVKKLALLSERKQKKFYIIMEKDMIHVIKKITIFSSF